MIEIQRLAFESMCIDELHMVKLKNGAKKTYDVIHDTLGKIGKAVCTMVEVKSMDYRVFLADVSTGSLYDPDTMRCMSGALTLK